jgi:ribosomal protein S18 acetylase RimI-like enzyme
MYGGIDRLDADELRRATKLGANRLFEILEQNKQRTIGLLRPVRDDHLTNLLHRQLMDASERLKESRAGHLPDKIVRDFVQQHYTSVKSICETFVLNGLRLCLMTSAGELVSTVLVSADPNIALVVDSTRMNVSTADVGLKDPRHQIFNFTTAYDKRRLGFGRELIEWLCANSERMGLHGIGLWTYVEPPDFQLYTRLGFTHVSAHDMYLFLPGSDNHAYNRRFLPSGSASHLPPDRKLKCFFMVREWTEKK